MASERPVVIETAQVGKMFRDFWMRKRVKALDNINLQIFRGEIFGLLGPNGSGKSTLVKILLGLLFPTTGRAAIFGRDPRNVAVKDRIGYMPEESYLYRYLDAEETLNFYGKLFNLPSAERRHRVELLLEMVGLTHQRQRPLVEYSKGMARRIGLAQALINDPDLVFLDEPTTGLDPIGTREIKDLIKELRNRGKTVFLCSHLLADVEDVCDRVAILYGGRVRRIGKIRDLLADRNATQITTPVLKPETVRRALAVIRESEGTHIEATVQPPRNRLEQVFHAVVEEAREARLETAGTTVGTGAAAYFEGLDRGEKADAILEDLLKAPEEKPEPSGGEREEIVVPATPKEPEPDRAVIADLLAPQSPDGREGKEDSGKEEAAESKRDRPLVLPADAGDKDARDAEQVLGDLLRGGSYDKDEDPDKDKTGQG